MIDKLQDLFIALFTPFIRVSNKLSHKVRYRAITFCFIINIVLFCIVQLVFRKENYFYNSFCGIFLMLIILLLSLDRPLKRVPWRKGICVLWFGLCLVLTLSDLFLPKPTCGLGLILGILFTGLFFVWENHSRTDLLWKCFKDSLKITFLVMSVLSFLFRPFFAGGRYAGIFTNPNTFGLYMFVIFTVFMSDVDWMVETNRPIKKQVLTMIQMALVLFYISVSQARTAMIAVAVVLIVWLACRTRIDFKRHFHKPFFKTIVLLVVFTAALYPVFFEGLNYIPDLVGHPVIYHDDTLYMQSGEKIEDVGEKLLKEEEAGEKANAEKAKKGGKNVPSTGGNKLSENNVLIRTVDTLINSLTGGSEGNGIDNLNRLSSGRITIYKAYSANLNVWGHRDVSMKINSHTVAHAHNNYLQYGYTYGVLAMILYGILTVLLCIRSIAFFLRGHRKFAAYSFLPCAIIVGFLAATMTECMFQPFEIYPAFAFWLACGACFQAKRAGGRK